MRAVFRARRRAALLATLVPALWLVIAASGPGVSLAAPAQSATVSASTFGRPMGDGYLGFSFEYSALHQYAGRNPDAINPMLLGLIRLLDPGQHPELRIGGDSSDDTWWPMRGVVPPGGINYALTKGWLRTARALADDLGARLIMGINLEAGRPALAATEARALLGGIGRRDIAAFEIGNEPDLYSSFYWYGNRLGEAFFGRASTYSFGDFLSEFGQWRSTLPSLPLAGPAFAGLTWLQNLPSFLAAERGRHLAEVTFHRYALRGCETDPGAVDYASIPNLLADSASQGLAAGVAPYVREAHAARIPFRLDELNSAACTGSLGVSDTFASALWVLDTLFELHSVGVDAINLHTLPGAAYQPFAFSESRGGTWRADVRPVYYGMLMFAQADPPGSRLLNVQVSPAGPLKVWGVRTPAGHTNLVLVNKSPTDSVSVHIDLAGRQGPLRTEMLKAPSVAATSGVSLGGQSFPAGARTPRLSGTAIRGRITPSAGGGYELTVPVATAMLLTR